MLSLLANLLLAHNNISQENTPKKVIQPLKEVQLLQKSKCYVLATSGWISFPSMESCCSMCMSLLLQRCQQVLYIIYYYLKFFLCRLIHIYCLIYFSVLSVLGVRGKPVPWITLHFCCVLPVCLFVCLCVRCNNGHPFSTLSIHGAVSWCMFVSCHSPSCCSEKVLNSTVSYVIFSFRGLFSLHR